MGYLAKWRIGQSIKTKIWGLVDWLFEFHEKSLWFTISNFDFKWSKCCLTGRWNLTLLGELASL